MAKARSRKSSTASAVSRSPSAIEKRKDDHIDLCRTAAVEFRQKTSLLEEVHLEHNALPDIAWDEIDTRVELFGKTLRAPVVIASMTGGTGKGAQLNLALAAFAEERGYAFGLGSQRPMLEDARRAASFAVRKVAPNVLLFGNLGVLQARDCGVARGLELVQSVDADAMFLHLNPAQEMLQEGGDRDFRGATETIGAWIAELGVPVVPKETGAGISRAVAATLRNLGATHVDVGGAGGTSWVGVEALRAKRESESSLVGATFWDWGIPTAQSVMYSKHAGLSPIATGGIRNGLDAARAISLGAIAVGVARPALVAFLEGGKRGLHQYFDRFERELRTAMLLVGARDLQALASAPRVLGPSLRAVEAP